MIRLNKSDYQLSLAYFIVASLWLYFRFRTDGISLTEISIDITVFWAKVIVSFFYFKFLVEQFIINSKRYFVFFTLLIGGLIFIGIIAYLLGIWSEGSSVLENIYPLSDLVIKGFYAVGADLTLFLGIIFSKKYYDQQLDNKNLEIINQDNEMKLLRQQFNPHFLFNNLNTIDSLIESDTKIAKEYVQHLASLYRFLLSNSDDDLVSLKKELDFMNSYIFLIETRFKDHYKFDIKVKQEIDNLFVPLGSIQTLVENIIKHNAPSDSEAIPVEILIDDQKIIVKNRKGTKSPKQTSKTGLVNLKLRYKNYTNNEILIKDEEDVFQVELPLINVSKA